MIWHHILDAFAAVFLPAPCRICEAPLETASLIPVCHGCLAQIEPLPKPQCPCCGRPQPAPFAASAADEVQLEGRLCLACRRGTYAFDVARSFAAYDDVMHHAVILLKYERITSLGRWFGARLAEVAAREGEVLKADCVMPVPLHRDRQRERGYNQAELIARPLARKLGLPLRSDLLARKLPRPPRLLLSRTERWQAVRGAFAVKEGKQVDKLRVLLVDDVFTTGATLDACARALRSAGAASVRGLTVARGVSMSSQGIVGAGNR